MKRLIISAGLALVLLFSLCSVALAGGGEEVSVECSDIVVVGDPYVGNTITASGTVTITAEATAATGKFTWNAAEAASTASYEVTDPNGNSVASDSNSEFDADLGSGKYDAASADASQTFSWSMDIYLNQDGEWVITQDGTAEAAWARFFLIFPTGAGADWDCDTSSLTVTAYYMPAVGYGTSLNFSSPQNSAAFHQTFGNTWTWWENGNTYTLYIPDGTEITGSNGTELGNCFITISNGVITILPPWAHFSQPVTIYQVVNGELVEMITFSQVENGVPIPLP